MSALRYTAVRFQSFQGNPGGESVSALLYSSALTEGDTGAILCPRQD